MPETAEALTAALDRLLGEIRATAAWLTDLDDERERAVVKMEKLRRAVRALAGVIPAEAHAARVEALASLSPGQPRLAPRPGPPIGRTERMAAVMHVLATHPTETIRTADLQRYLTSHALAKDSRAAARALAKKAKQGIVEREDWGRYRINADHPELVKVREGMASET